MLLQTPQSCREASASIVVAVSSLKVLREKQSGHCQSECNPKRLSHFPLSSSLTIMYKLAQAMCRAQQPLPETLKLWASSFKLFLLVKTGVGSKRGRAACPSWILNLLAFDALTLGFFFLPVSATAAAEAANNFDLAAISCAAAAAAVAEGGLPKLLLGSGGGLASKGRKPSPACVPTVRTGGRSSGGRLLVFDLLLWLLGNDAVWLLAERESDIRLKSEAAKDCRRSCPPAAGAPLPPSASGESPAGTGELRVSELAAASTDQASCPAAAAVRALLARSAPSGVAAPWEAAAAAASAAAAAAAVA
mmetsp:Transcript_48692/g.115711  ORF Transcript_48692/g.115711 Transcript_48692/m.115711 type:complete len:306 (+) Transcript_48692:121-1038(+)